MRGDRLQPARSLRSDDRGAAAVEFAIIAPVFLLLSLAGSELSIALTLNQKIETVSSTASDLATQVRHLPVSEIDDMFEGVRAVVSPYDGEPLQITLTGVGISPAGVATVEWSRGSTASPTSQAITLPKHLIETGVRFVVMAEASYLYTPMGGYGLTEPFELRATSFSRPRIGGRVECDGC